MLTVRKEQEVREAAQALGADAYLTKPFIMDDLVDLIHEKLSIKRDGHLTLVTPEEVYPTDKDKQLEALGKLPQ